MKSQWLQHVLPKLTNCILDMHLSVLWCAHHQRCVHDGEAKTMHKATQTQTQTHTHTLTLTRTHTHTPTNTNSVKHLTSKPVLAGKCHCASHKTVVASIGCLCHRKIKTCAQPVLAPKSLLVFCLPFPRHAPCAGQQWPAAITVKAIRWACFIYARLGFGGCNIRSAEVWVLLCG